MYQSSLWPSISGVTIITEFSVDDYYMIPKSQYLVFPFSINTQQPQIRIDATHTTFYDNQQGTITAWISDQVIGRSITGDYNSNLARTQLQADGYSWLLYMFGNEPIEDNDPVRNSTLFSPYSFQIPKLKQWIYPDKTYFMCFQNRENKDNGLFAKFTNL